MQFMETINMGNLINSRLAFIELIKILYQISCSGEQDVYRNNCISPLQRKVLTH